MLCGGCLWFYFTGIIITFSHVCFLLSILLPLLYCLVASALHFLWVLTWNGWNSQTKKCGLCNRFVKMEMTANVIVICDNVFFYLWHTATFGKLSVYQVPAHRGHSPCSEWWKEAEASPVCDPNEIRQPGRKGFHLINTISWPGWHTCSIRCPAALVRSNMTALAARDLA